MLPAVPVKEVQKMVIPFVDVVATGQNINQLHIDAGLSVKDLQTVFGFATPQAIYKWIHGTALPSIDNLVILAKILNVTMDDIVIVGETVIMQCS